MTTSYPLPLKSSSRDAAEERNLKSWSQSLLYVSREFLLLESRILAGIQIPVIAKYMDIWEAINRPCAVLQYTVARALLVAGKALR